MKLYEINKLDVDLQRALKGAPVAYPVVFTKTKHRDGSETRQEFKKISETHAEKTREFKYS